MRVREVIRAGKSNIELGQWSIGSMPPSHFRIFKQMKTIKQGQDYSWRIVKFSIDDTWFRVLILLNQAKQIYRATLAVEVGEEVRIICVREFHVREPGWHCHAVLRCEQGVSTWTHRGLRRYPRGFDLPAQFDVTSQTRATNIALRFFNIAPQGGLL